MSVATAPPAPPSVRAGRERLLQAGFVALCLLLAVSDLGGRSVYHRDLARFGTIAREMIRGGDWLVPTQYGDPYANKPILYVWAVALPSAIAGDVTETWIRLPSALGLLMAVFAAHAWARARGASAAYARLAALLVATTAFVNLLGRSGRPDMLAAGLSAWAAFLLDRAVLGLGRPRDGWAAGLLLGAALLAKGPAVALLPLLLVLLPRRGVGLGERLRRSRLLLVLGVGLALPLLWLVPATVRGGLDFARRLVVDQVAERVQGVANHVEPPWFYALEVPLDALPWSPVFLLALLAFAWRRVREALGGGTHAAAALLALAVLSAVPTKAVRYAAPIVPALAVVAAQATAWAVARWARGAWLARAAFASALLAAGAALAYWPVYARAVVPQAVRENRAVLAALEPGVPAVVLRAPERLSLPDELFYVLGSASFAREPEALPPPAAAPRLTVVTLAGRTLAADAARGERGRDVAQVARRDGSVLVVRRYGPP